MQTLWLVGASARLRVDVAEGRLERIVGLIGARPDRALLLERTRSVHTFGMRHPIDAVLLDVALRVVAIVRLPPRRLLLPRRGVRNVLEVASAPFATGEQLGVEWDRRAGSATSTRPGRWP